MPPLSNPPTMHYNAPRMRSNARLSGGQLMHLQFVNALQCIGVFGMHYNALLTGFEKRDRDLLRQRAVAAATLQIQLGDWVAMDIWNRKLSEGEIKYLCCPLAFAIIGGCGGGSICLCHHWWLRRVLELEFWIEWRRWVRRVLEWNSGSNGDVFSS